MQIEARRLIPHISMHVPGAPYYATWRKLRGADAIHRNHDYAEFTAITAGEGRLVSFVEGREPRVEPLLPGQLYLFRPIDVQEFTGVGPDGVMICNIAFPITEWQAYMRLAGLDQNLMTASRPALVQFDADDPDALHAHQRALDRFWRGATMLDLIEFWTAMAHLFAPRDPAHAPGTPDWLLHALEEMRELGNLRLGMDRFIALSHVSPAHLWRTCVRYCGMTPTEFLSQLRMRHAAMLLGTTSESVASIADLTGFASASYFSKAFRRAHLVTPSQYRARAISGISGRAE